MSATRPELVRWLVIASASLAVAVAIPFDLLPWLRGPAPYPPEWRWGYRTGGPVHPLVAAGVLAAVVLAFIAATSGRWVLRWPRAVSIALLVVATTAAWGLQVAVLERDPVSPLRSLMARALSPSISSYHAAAFEEERESQSFLDVYAARFPAVRSAPKHAATHPPGLVLFYRAAIDLCEWSPALTNALLRTAAVPGRASETELGRALRASALLGALVLGALSVLSVWPLALLAEALGLAPLAAARVALLWTLVPAFLVMSPAHDAAIALPVSAWALLLALAGATRSPGGQLVVVVLAGACGGIAIFASYASMTFLGMGALAVLAARSADRPATGRTFVVTALATTLALLLAFGVPAMLGGRPLEAMRTALHVHRAAFTAPRSYWLWLVFNPLDLALFLGLPIAIAGLWAARRALQRLVTNSPLGVFDRFRLAVFGGMALVLVLGLVRGEVGRILIPLMPLVLLASVADDRSKPEAVEALGLATLLVPLTLLIAGYWIV
jgi:hypothetical protein